MGTSQTHRQATSLLLDKAIRGGFFHRPQLRALPEKAGCKNTLEAEAEADRAVLMRQLPLVEQAMGSQMLALRQLEAACTNTDDLAEAAAESFEKHPDAEIITSFPGLRALGARVLAESGDDRSRFAGTRGLKAYAGSTPIMRASGKSVAVPAWCERFYGSAKDMAPNRRPA